MRSPLLKLVNVLDQLPKKVQAMGREMLCAIPYADTCASASIWFGFAPAGTRGSRG